MELALLLAATLGGTCLTFFVPLPLPPWPRLASGLCLGTVILGLAALVLGSWSGLGAGTVASSALVALAPTVALAHPAPRGRARAAWREARAGIAALRQQPVTAALVIACGLGAGALLWRVFDRSCFQDEQGIHTADSHNFGDLPFHLGVVQGFVRGRNFPPEHPELAGARLTYPFLVDLVTALMVKAGAPQVRAIVVHDTALAIALMILLYHMARRWTGDRTAALLTPLLVFLSGGLGFALVFRDAAATGSGLWNVLARPPDDYTIRTLAGLRWGNALTTLLVTQRSFLMGLPLFVLAATLWWEALRDGDDDARGRRGILAAAGAVAGALPLVHGHSFAAAMAIAVALAILFPRRDWLAFFAVALVLAAPQAVWMARGTSMQAGRFFAFEAGWDRVGRNPLWFWLWNTGAFIPLLVAAFAWRRGGVPLVPRRLARFYLPFACCFVVPNLVRLSPWIWDNIKFLFLWWVASAPLVALVLARLFRGRTVARVAGAVLLVAATLAGLLDVAAVARAVRPYVVFSAEALAAADAIAAVTAPRAMILRAPTHDSPILLTGRRSPLGYEGHLWSQGLSSGSRPEQVARIYRNGAAARTLLDELGIDYVLIGPQERREYRISEPDWSSFPVVVQSGRYRLYQVR